MKKKTDIVEIDLHGLKHQEVPRYLEAKINELWDTDTEVNIVTGHSEAMKNIVREILSDYSLDCNEDHPFNKGMIQTTI